ncbi:MAG TPA: oxidoreductase [Trebonia sp.]|nr:oxidoreductase [Trebonia sp.]
MSASAAGTWRLGDLEVGRLGFGAMRLTGSLPFQKGTPSDRGRSIAALRRAVELGVNHIDTAAFYFSELRSANELINTALGPYPDDLVIVTKVGPGRDPWGEWYSARPNQLRGQVEENLRQLGRDHLDVVNLRRMRQESIADHFGALAELRNAGLIRHLGVSDVSVTQLEEALAIAPVVCVQNRYSLDVREHDPVLRACTERSIAFVPFFSIAGGQRQAAGAAGESAELTEVARRHEATPAQVRLAWALHQAPNVLVIPGTGNPDHVTENVAAGALRLSADDLALLDGADAALRVADRLRLRLAGRLRGGRGHRGQQSRQRLQVTRGDAVADRGAVALGRDQARLAQHLQVRRDRRL